MASHQDSQRVKRLPRKPDDTGLILRNYVRVKGENRLLKVVL